MADNPCKLTSGATRFNQLGGAYMSGKPLPEKVRLEIVALAKRGVRQCEISRRLRITHGCVSKLISKYQRTGSVDPRGESGSRLRCINPAIAKRIEELAKEQPGIFSWEISNRLVQENACSPDTLPYLSSIRRQLAARDYSERNGELINQLDQCTGQHYQKNATILNLLFNLDRAARDYGHQPRALEIAPNSAQIRDPTGEEQFRLPITRRERTRYTIQQLCTLEETFKRNCYLSASAREQLVKDTGLNKTKIQVWFSNRRAKEKKQSSKEVHHESQPTKDYICHGNVYVPVPPLTSEPGPSRIIFPAWLRATKGC